MSNDFERPEGEITLEDQAFLKELGISGLSNGLEKALNQYKAAMRSKSSIESRAEGLRSLNLDKQTLAKLAREEKTSLTEMERKTSFFRDVEKDLPE